MTWERNVREDSQLPIAHLADLCNFRPTTSLSEDDDNSLSPAARFALLDTLTEDDQLLHFTAGLPQGDSARC